ncbi:MAG: DUF2817 domain-containing protein [Gammaproteobacteria bacterium]|nr:MAG: DUF2817 domain-containing protein [Gammaproteobacteria bacterium]
MSYNSLLQAFSEDLFPRDYQQACDLWQEAVHRLPVTHFQNNFTLDHAQGLVCQTAWIGPDNARNVLVLISGTHGVEGYAGTAVELDCLHLLETGVLQLPAKTSLLLINALNPWGYAHHRRCDDQGVDVNRNFIDFSQPLPVNKGYLELQPLLAIADSVSREQAIEHFRNRVGQREYEIAYSGGQYSDSTGPFFGGSGPSFSRSVIEELITRYHLAERQLAVIDIHTGLGPYGYGEVICDHPVGSGSENTAREWFGPGCGLPDAGTSCSVPKLGLLDYAWHQVMGSESCFVTLEFGTLGTESLFSVLHDEACAWIGNTSGAMTKENVAVQMLDHFNPQDIGWRESVIFRARQVIEQALQGLSQNAGKPE